MSRAFVLGLLVVVASCKDDAPAAPAASTAGKVLEVTGKVTATYAGATPVALHVGDGIGDDDVIDTGADGRIAIELAHNRARWELGPNKHQKVNESIAWSLPKQDGTTKPVEQDTSSAGRNAERSAADSTATTTPAPAVGGAGPPPPEPKKEPDQFQSPPATKGAAPSPPPATKGAAPSPPPPPIQASDRPAANAAAPADVAPVAPGGGDAKQDAKSRTRGQGKDLALADSGGKKAHDVLVAAADDLAKCLSTSEKATIVVTIAADGSGKIGGLDVWKPLHAGARQCLDGVVKKLKFPAVAGTTKIELER